VRRALFALLFVACAEPAPPVVPKPPPPPPAPPAPACVSPLAVHFYDAGQALAALVELADGRKILVDTGDSPTRPDCTTCKAAHEHVMQALARDLRGKSVDMVWLTHPHSDHVGGAAAVLTTFGATYLVDNGRDLEKPAPRAARQAAAATGTHVRVVDPAHSEVPLVSTSTVKIAAVVPRVWPTKCTEEKDVNACSIGLRIDACRSSVLFTGDAPAVEEEAVSPGEITLLQVGHHGSATSTSAAFLERIRPKYAVIPSAKPYEGMNETYCHPRAKVVAALTKALGGSPGRPLKAFDGAVKCEKGTGQAEHWLDVPASDHLFATARDGDVRLTTSGDGVFTRVP